MKIFKHSHYSFPAIHAISPHHNQPPSSSISSVYFTTDVDLPVLLSPICLFFSLAFCLIFNEDVYSRAHTTTTTQQTVGIIKPNFPIFPFPLLCFVVSNCFLFFFPQRKHNTTPFRIVLHIPSFFLLTSCGYAVTHSLFTSYRSHQQHVNIPYMTNYSNKLNRNNTLNLPPHRQRMDTWRSI